MTTDLDLAVRGNCTAISVISLPGRHVRFRFPRLSGSFPQTSSRFGLISVAMRLSRSSEEGMWHGS
jgi:hypothetical protein